MKNIILSMVFLCGLGLSQVSFANPELVGTWEHLVFACKSGSELTKIVPFNDTGRMSLTFTSSSDTEGTVTMEYSRLDVNEADGVSCSTSNTSNYEVVPDNNNIIATVTENDTGNCTGTSSGLSVGTRMFYTYSIEEESGRLYLAPNNPATIHFACDETNSEGEPVIVFVKM